MNRQAPPRAVRRLAAPACLADEASAGGRRREGPWLQREGRPRAEGASLGLQSAHFENERASCRKSFLQGRYLGVLKIPEK